MDGSEAGGSGMGGIRGRGQGVEGHVSSFSIMILSPLVKSSSPLLLKIVHTNVEF